MSAEARRAIRAHDLAGLHAPLQGELEAALLRVARSGKYVLGEEVAAFEREVATFLGVAHAIGVSSGSDALWLALAAVGVGPGDRVLVPAFSFFATAGSVLRLGARPCLVDVEPEGLLLDLERAAAQRCGARAAVPVHLYGRMVDPDRLADALPGLPVIADAAQAFGARRGQRGVAGAGTAATFSFFPTKPLGGLGDGGLVTTSDAEIAARVYALRQHGARERGLHEALGANHRLDALQAAALLVKLRHAEAWRARRAKVAAAYDELLADLPEVTRPPADPGSAHALYTVRVPAERRDRVRDVLLAQGIEVAVHYPRPLHLQPALASLGHGPGDFPVAERAAREVLCLPLHPGLEESDVYRVVEALAAALGR